MAAMSPKSEALTLKLMYIFLGGLLLQFVAQTFITYVIGRENTFTDILWLRKELFIGILFILWRSSIIFQKKLRLFFRQAWFLRFLAGFVGWVVMTAIIHIGILQLPLTSRVLAFKYDFLGFVIFFAGLWCGYLLKDIQKKELIKWYTIRIMKLLLLWALLRYMIIFVKPGTLKLLGYDNFVYEGVVGQAPPAAYYNFLNYGVPRNQFLFERPITRWFFLIALRPLFFMQVLYKQPLRTTRARRGIYGINVFITFSRAARWARFMEILLLGALLAQWNVRRTLIRLIVPMIAIMAAIVYIGGKNLVHREYSTNGHRYMVQRGFEYLASSPRRGIGWASVWPGSHHLWGLAFNPENQFLQILVEFWIVWSLGWFICYGILSWLGIYLRKKKDRQGDHLSAEEKELLLSCSVGMVGLAIAGMVLHSFTDRMIVYPYMLIFGCIASSLLINSNNNSLRQN